MPAQKLIRVAIAFGIVGASATVAYGQLGAISKSLFTPETPVVEKTAAESSPLVQNAIADGTITVAKPLIEDDAPVTETRVDLTLDGTSPVVVTRANLGFATLTPGTHGQSHTLPLFSVPDTANLGRLSITDGFDQDGEEGREEIGGGFVDESSESAFEVEPVLTPRPLRIRTGSQEPTIRRTSKAKLNVWYSGAYR